MKKNIFQFFTLFLLTVMVLGTSAQDRRTMDTKVADVLAQMPTRNLTHLDKAMNEIYETGDEGFQKIADRLVPAGTGDDTAVRFALNSFARYASQFGMAEARKMAEQNLLAALEKQKDVEVKTFLLNQLNLVGSARTSQAVKGYLNNDELVEPATQTILMIDNPGASQLFLDAFTAASANAKITLARALGELQCKRAVSLIAPMLSSDDVASRKTALAALANIGAAESFKPLLKAANDVKFAYENTNAAAAFIDYTNRLGEQNQLELMQKACKAIYKANTSPELLHNYAEALYISSKYTGYETTPLLLKAVDNPDNAFRNAVLNIAEKTGGVADTRKWIAKAESATPDVRAEIISMLGRRGCALASGLLSKNLENSSANVREASIVAVAQLQKKEAIPALVKHLASGRDTKLTQEMLATLLDKEHLFLLAGELKNTSGDTKATAIELMAAKAGSQYFNEVLAETSSSDEAVKKAAFDALKNISTYENVEELIDLLAAVNNEEEIAQTQAALIAATQGVATEQNADGKILTALKMASKKERIFPVLPEIGGQAALETISDYFNTSSGTQKDAAFDALSRWKEYAAAQSLFNICEEGNTKYQPAALENFVRLVRETALPGDQKLLQYRKIMQYAKTPDQQNKVIASIGSLKTFLSVVYLEKFLDNKELSAAAARSIMNISLPNGGQNKGLSGEIVRRALTKAEKTLSGADSEYEKININRYLAEMPGDKGFVSMFNGKNLDGWQGMLLNGNPIAIAKLSEAERAKEQTKADEKMHENWSVQDGMIIFNGHGANLVSQKIYKDFEMIVDWRISKEGDSGIYLRGTPQVQIWDTSRVAVGAQVGSGGLYNNNADNIRNPLKVADNPIDEWNTFRITMIGENVTVYLNGELVVDNVRMDNYWDRSIPIFSEGTIELQAHGNELAFRDVYVREINTEQIGLSEKEIGEGFVSLFNGSNLDGWQGNKTDYHAANGELVVDPEMGGHGNLFSEKEYSDFVFRFEFKLTPGANNGLGIRAPLDGDAAYVGMELQILDNTAPIYADLYDWQYHGSVYGIIAAKRGYLNPVGEWNTEEVTVQGSKIKIVLNGVTIVDGDINEASKNGTLDGKDHPGLQREKGHIGFLGHGSKLWFRNIRIKDLSK